MYRNQVNEVVTEERLPMAHNVWKHRSGSNVEKWLGVWYVANEKIIKYVDFHCCAVENKKQKTNLKPNYSLVVSLGLAVVGLTIDTLL